MAVLSSISETWGNGNWIPYKYGIDLDVGLPNLIEASMNCNNCLNLNYERLVTSPSETINEVLQYLDLSAETLDIKEENIPELVGVMGDPIGQYQYPRISEERAKLDYRSICNTYRKRSCINYLQQLGKTRLEYIGYNYSESIQEIKSLNTGSKKFFSDLLLASYGVAYNLFEPSVFKDKLKSRELSSWKSHKVS